MKYTEKNISSISFWRDSTAIEGYAQSILSYLKKDDISLQIKIGSENIVPVCIYRNPGFIIELPKPKDYYFNEENMENDILSRKVFLKHELAHIIFSDFSLFNDHHSKAGSSFHFIWNALEDIRIEYLFGKKFEGANDSFFTLQSKYFEKAKPIIEKSKISIEKLGLYFLFKSKGNTFLSTKATNVYEDVFQKYGNFVNLSAFDLKKTVNSIIDYFNSIEKENSDIEQKQKEEEKAKEEEDKEQKIEKNNKEEIKNQQEDSKEDEEEAEDELENDQNSDSSGEEENDNNEALSTDDNQETDSEEDQELGSENSDLKNEDNEEDNDDIDLNDTQSMINDLMKDSLNSEMNSLKDSLGANNDIETRNDLKEKAKNPSLLSDIFKPHTSQEYELYKNLTYVQDSMYTYKEGMIAQKESQVIPIRKFLKKILSQKRDEVNHYSEVVKENKKNIVNLVNHFKLRFQNKEKSKMFYNKDEGILHNDSLHKILLKGKNDHTVFSRIENAMITKSNVVFLIDFSGSMHGVNIQKTLESMIIMNEVFSKLGIPYEFYSFCSSSNYNFRFPKKVTNLRNFFDSSKIHYSEEINRGKAWISSKNNKELIFQYRSINDKDFENDKKILNYLYAQSKNGYPSTSGGGTPEIEAVLSLRKYCKFPNKKLFVLNDGEYSNTSFRFDGQSDKEVSTKEDIYSHIAIKIFLSLLLGKDIQISSPSEIGIFHSIADIVLNAGNVDYEIIHYFQELTTPDVKKNYQQFLFFLRSIVVFFNSLNYDLLLKKEKIKINDNCTLNISSSNKKITLSLSIKKDFNLIGYVIERNGKEPYTENPYYGSKNVYIGKENWDYESLCTVFCFYISSLRHSLHSSSNRVDKIYKSLFEKMRNEGWDVYGVGINSNLGKKYIGEKYFTTVNTNELKETFALKIKEIV